ncbi:MFS transporter [Marinococcus halophilus]|uniref:MFS transporter n=1 Tax=Marinococcus halophilus TaxID=1371 RepID=UPI00361D62ED
MPEEAATQIPAKTRNLIIAVFLTGAFIAILNQTLLAVAIPSIMADLNVSANTAQWVTTVFMLVNGIMIPITAFLIEKFTTRGLFLFAMCSFALGTLFAALSPTFGLLMAGRVIQGVGAGIMIPLMQTSIMTMFPISQRGQAMGLAGLAIAFAPAFGPTLSGWVVDSYSWNTLFYIILPIAIVDIILAYFLLKNVTELKHPKLDLLSIMLSTAGFGGLLYGFRNPEPSIIFRLFS